MKYFISVFAITFTLQSFAQIINPLHFPNQDSNNSNKESFLLGLSDNSMLMFWADRETNMIHCAKSTNNGLSWGNTNQIISIADPGNVDINAVVLNSGKILATYKTNRYQVMYSDDNGETWQGYLNIPTFYLPAQQLRVAYSSLSEFSDGTAAFIFSYSPYNFPDTIPHRGIYIIRTSDGINWSTREIIDSSGRNGDVVNAGTDKDILVYETTDTPFRNLVYRTSSNGGFSWSERQLLLSDGYNNSKPCMIKDSTGKIWLLYYRDDHTAFQGYSQSEIFFMTSTDQGLNWTLPVKFTNYAGDDDLLSLSTWNGLPIVSFTSSRDFNIGNNFFQIYYGIPGVTADFSTPPYLSDHSIIPLFPEGNEPITFRAFADDENLINSVKVITDVNGNFDSLDLFDDGMHNDSLPGDNIFGGILENGLPNWVELYYNFLLTDIDNNIAGFDGDSVLIPNFIYIDAYLVEANKLKLPIKNNGMLADLEINNINGLHFDESSVLYSGGFYLSGYHQNQIWTNAVASASLIFDYLPGPVGSDPNDFRNSVHVIKSSDPHFGQSWISYKYAVDVGADFYDGDGDEIYNPVDLNQNGIWDSNEDRPDFLGDVTAWCVYNDGVPASQRRFNQVNPMGIEIQQTLFAISNESNPIDNMIFIRYRIINKGTVSTQFDSVYFGLWDDPDIGGTEGYTDDLTGCDTLINLGYGYNDGDDPSYGINPPSFGSQLLAGPVVYIPGETFIDVNGNNIYDEGIDTPIDTAVVNKGIILGAEYYPGAKNLEVSSFIHYINGDPTMSDPSDHIEARNYLLGRNRLGQLINPCNWQYGYVYGIPCDQVNPIFLYSGNPTSNFGWINTYPADQRTLTSVGPFSLKQNENVDIWTAYIVGRGSNSLESITKMKANSLGAVSFYKSNFTVLPSDVGEDKDIKSPNDFSLFQNYPNPFNPSTNIEFRIEDFGLVTLKVYDILGREIATLVNEEKNAGTYTVTFNAFNLASGIYFYQLRAGGFVETKKMVLMK